MIDLSNPLSPFIKGVMFDEDGSKFIRGGHHLRVVGNYVYVTGLLDGIGVVKF